MNSTIGELAVVEMLNLNVTPCEGMFVSLTDCDILIVLAGHRHHLDSVYQKQVGHRGGGGDTWQPMMSRIELVEAYLRFVKVGKIVEIKKMCFRRRLKVRVFVWESCGGR